MSLANPRASRCLGSGSRFTWLCVGSGAILAGSALHELPGLIGDRMELLSLELQRAGQVLAQIVALIVAAAILAVTVWPAPVRWGDGGSH